MTDHRHPLLRHPCNLRRHWPNGLGHFRCRKGRDAETGEYISVLDARHNCPRCGLHNDHPEYHGRLVHDFRRTAAHEAWKSGSSIEECKEITGHTSDAMFKRYADLFSEEEKCERQRKAQERRREYREAQEKGNLLRMPAIGGRQ